MKKFFTFTTVVVFTVVTAGLMSCNNPTPTPPDVDPPYEGLTVYAVGEQRYYGDWQKTGAKNFYLYLAEEGVIDVVDGRRELTGEDGILAFLDINSDLAVNMLPSVGTYSADADVKSPPTFAPFTFTFGNTAFVSQLFGTYVYEIIDSKQKRYDITAGTIVISTVAAGLRVDADLDAYTGENFKFRYEGTPVFTDYSADTQQVGALKTERGKF
ncbi:MAG: hypothetical protein LBS01_01805 [Prevotellaceae bacterium]|nr:hypothetical protein [Prevotellaceae bacterium]